MYQQQVRALTILVKWSAKYQNGFSFTINQDRLLEKWPMYLTPFVRPWTYYVDRLIFVKLLCYVNMCC